MNAKSDDPGRRAFIGRASAAVAGSLTLAAGSRAVGDATSVQAGAIHELHREYLHRVSSGALEQLPELFSPGAHVWFNGGVFVAPAGVRRLYVEHFGGRRHCEPVHLQLLERPHADDSIEIASDGTLGRARLHCLVQAQSAFQSTATIVEMARQQGQSAVQWWECGRFDTTYARLAQGWRITSLRYVTLPPEPRDATPSGPRTRPQGIARFSACYPEHPAGPDQLEPLAL